MATFKAVVRTKRTDGTYLVYIRCTHNRKIEYIKTDMYVSEKKIKKGEIADIDINGRCAITIMEWQTKLNREDISSWSVKDVVSFLENDNTSIPFIPYCQKFIDKMINEGREKSASNYIRAKNSFEQFFNKNISFQEINTNDLTKWIKSLKDTARAKETYPKCIKAMFDAGCLEYNDYNKNIIRIASRPFMGVKIPKHDLPKKRAIDANKIRMIFEFEADTKRKEEARDVAMLIFYLVGMNTVDLFGLKHSNIKDGKICYNRSKTKGERQDKAYIEIAIHEDIVPILEKWKGEERLLDFGHSNDRVFNRAVNVGLKQVCTDLGIDGVDTYTFRHSWATIAQNKCGASTELVAFCLNHGSAHKVTEGYIEKDFTPIDKMNRKVLDYIFQRGEYAQKKEAD